MYEAFKNYVPRDGDAGDDRPARGRDGPDRRRRDDQGRGRRRQPRPAAQDLSEIDESQRGPGQSRLGGDGPGPHPRPLQGLRRGGPQEGGRLAQHAAHHPREKIGQALRRLHGLDRATTPSSCDQTFPLPQRGDVFKLEERCSICGETPRLKVVPFRGRPWNLCLNDDCQSMQEMKKRRAEREAAKAAKEAMAKKPLPEGDEDGAPAKAKKSSKADTATRGPQTRQSRRQRLRPRPLFISLEGSTARARARRRSCSPRRSARRPLLIREPGGTDAAERIRELLADPALELDPFAELLLFFAARADLVARVIRPAPRGRAATSSPTASPTRASPTRAAPAGWGRATCSRSPTP